jgi:UPF0042 nucleotide-binding protein
LNVPSPQRANARFVVVTGLSGSGKSTALKALEDLGFYAIDNLPVQLLPAFANLPLEFMDEPFKAALVMDLRAPRFVEMFPRLYDELVQKGYKLELLFLEAGNEALLRRFSQTRRQHPLTSNKGAVAEGVHRERELLLPLRQRASQIVDTSRFTVHELRQEITRLFSRLASLAPMQLNLMTFGYKYGLPPEADLVFDVRFLINPYFVDDLSGLDGRDPRVVNYVFKQEAMLIFLQKLKDMLGFLLPLYHQEGKSQLTVAIGCTGGKHRSVTVVEWLARELAGSPYRLTMRHRDINLG